MPRLRVCVVSLFIALVLLAITVRRTGSFYIYPLGIIVCTSYDECAHERGHKLDQEHEFISQTPEFQAAIDLYTRECAHIDDTVPLDILLGVVIVCGIVEDFPGVNAPHKPYSNPLQAFIYGYHDYNGWGGYDELYAEIFEFKEYVILPAELVKYWP